MGFDTMRMNSGRCPPFLVAGLLVACVLLTCNWWTLSSQNYDILKELEEMGEQLKKCSTQRSLCESEKGIAESRLQAQESLSNTNQVKMTQELRGLSDQLNEKDDRIKELETSEKQKETSLKTCETNLENLKGLDESRSGVLQMLRLEKAALEKNLQEQKEKTEKLETEINELKVRLSSTPEKPSNNISPGPAVFPKTVSPEMKQQSEQDENDNRFEISPEDPVDN